MLKVDERTSGVADRVAIQLSENSRAVLERRYLRRGPEGTPIETVEEMFYRVASHVALAEEETGGDVKSATGRFAQATLIPPINFSRENSSRVPSRFTSNGVAKTALS